MNTVLDALSTNADKSIRLAEVELGAVLRGEDLLADQVVLTPDEAALRLCKTSPEYTSGPFTGFHRVLGKTNNPEEAHEFIRRVAVLNGRMLLMPTADGRIFRTLVTLGNNNIVNLATFGAETRFKATNNERTVLSAVRGFYSSMVGSHETGTLKTEPGHVALTSGVVLGAYATQDVHKEVHSITDTKANTQRNILLATTQQVGKSPVGVRVPPREYSYETWPKGLELLWHPEDGNPEIADGEDAMRRVQAAGFVAVRSEGKIQDVMNILGAMH